MMKEITTKQISQAIDDFLEAQFQKKSEKARKALSKADKVLEKACNALGKEAKDFKKETKNLDKKPKDLEEARKALIKATGNLEKKIKDLDKKPKDPAEERKALEKAIWEGVQKSSELEQQLVQLKEKYQKANWFGQAERMAGQLKFGTHISKGIHPDAKGDNIRFDAIHDIPFVGSHSLKSNQTDSNGNAAALPLAEFFDWWVDESKNIKIRDVILVNPPTLVGVFADDDALSEQYRQAFFNSLSNQISTGKTHERNKQLFWPVTDDDYHVINPLYPSVFTHELFQKINTLRYSDANKLAYENRNKKAAEQLPYISIKDLAIVHLGGTQPQNISQLASKQSGRYYLLPSMPPPFTGAKDLSIAKSAKSLFDVRSLKFLLKESLDALFNNINIKHNTVHIREGRKAIIDDILLKIIQIAIAIQETRPAGWSRDYKLNMAQKYWLDPNRGKLEGEEDFQNQRDRGDWKKELERQFADWLQGVLRQRFKAIAQDFSDAEHTEWRREMQDAIKQSELTGQGAFQ